MFIARIFIAKFREMLINPNELFEVAAFFDSWNQSKFLKIFLQNFLALINQAIASCDCDGILLLSSSYNLFCELNRRLGELYIGVLINQFFMEEAKSFILLAYNPFFLVELDIDDVFSILTIVNWIIINPCRLYCEW